MFQSASHWSCSVWNWAKSGLQSLSTFGSNFGGATGDTGVLGDQASTALAKLPMPAIAGVTLGTPTVRGADAFVAADVPVQ